MEKELIVEDKFINYLMQRGKKSIARTIFADTLKHLEEKQPGKVGLEVFKKALENICPSIEVRPRRVGGSVYQIPIEVIGDRRISLGLRWLIAAAKSKKGKPMAICIAEELLAALDNQGNAVRKKEDVHKMAKANKAYAHFARYAKR